MEVPLGVGGNWSGSLTYCDVRSRVRPLHRGVWRASLEPEGTSASTVLTVKNFPSAKAPV